MSGAFCAIKDWHPAISKCEETKELGIIYRTLTTKDGAKIKEKLVDKTDTSYTYEIIDSPLPVQNYRAEIGVSAEADKTRVDWKSTFDAKGVSDAEAKKVISEIYKTGLDKIAKTAGDYRYALRSSLIVFSELDRTHRHCSPARP